MRSLYQEESFSYHYSFGNKPAIWISITRNSHSCNFTSDSLLILQHLSKARHRDTQTKNQTNKKVLSILSVSGRFIDSHLDKDNNNFVM